MSLYKEDVYETEDLPEPEPDDNEEYFENKEIEKVHVDLNAAKRRFGNCLLDSGGAGLYGFLLFLICLWFRSRWFKVGFKEIDREETASPKTMIIVYEYWCGSKRFVCKNCFLKIFLIL